MYHNTIKLYNKLQSNHFNKLLQMKKKKRCMKNIILIIYLLKVKDLLNGRRKMKKKVNHSRRNYC